MQQTTIDQAIEREIAATAVHIPLDLIQPGPNDRQTFDKKNLQQLAADINESGLQQPITVRPFGDRYEIVCGERRFRAHQLLGRETIACFVRELSDEEADLVMLAENVQRVQLNPIEEARGFEKQIEKYGRTEKEIASKCNVSVDLVRRRLGLLALISDVQHQVAAGHLKVGHAECMVGLDSNFQLQALRQLNDRGDISQKVFSRICNELLEQQDQATMFDLDSLFAEKKAEYEAEKAERKEAKAAVADLQAEIDHLRAALAAEQAAHQAVEQERDLLAAELENERAQRQVIEQERDTLQVPQSVQPASTETSPVIPFPRRMPRRRSQKPIQACQIDAFGVTYHQLDMFSGEELCQHNTLESLNQEMNTMGNGGAFWYSTRMAA
jgi:ParB family chromosome partitioning protein